jgi:DNA repair protein RecO (recombination protein O)
MTQLKTQGGSAYYDVLVIKTVPYKENDLLVKILSPELGFVRSFAQGALKSQKRFGGGVLQPLHYIRVLLEIKKSPGSLSLLHEAQLLEDFNGLKQSYHHLSTALRFLSYYDQILLEGDSCQNLFYLLGHTLRALSQKESSYVLIETQFLAKLLFDQGVLDSGSESVSESVSESSLESSFYEYIESSLATPSFSLQERCLDHLNQDLKKLQYQWKVYLGF